MRVLDCRKLCTNTLPFPAPWTSYMVNISPSGADEVRCALGMIWAVLSGQGSWTCSSTSWCWELPAAVPLWGPKYAVSLCTRCQALRLCGGMNRWLDGCIQILGLGTWTVKATRKCSFLIHLSYIFTRKGVLRPKAVRTPECPCVPGFGLTLCMGKELDHVPEQWGYYPGRPSCRWQQTNISHYIFPFSEGYSLSSWVAK